MIIVQKILLCSTQWLILAMIILLKMQNNQRLQLINNGDNTGVKQDGQQDDKNYQSKLGLFLTALRIPCSKTSDCKHKCGCIQSILKSSLKITAFSYVIKLALSTLFKLKTIFTKPSLLLTLFKDKQAMNFGLFLGSFVLIFRSLFCALRRCISQENKRYIPLIAGAIGGLISCFFLDRKTRQSFALFLMARAIDISYQNLVRKGYLPEFKYFYVVMYSICMTIAGYCYSNEPGCIPPEINKFYLDFANESIGDMQMRQIWTERKNIELAQYGIAPQDPLSYMPKLRKYYQSLTKKI